ncbi:P63C domain-containing protein [Citricoccus alkalitolerans]|uniref:P63C domain-containing protein n=1 Tax=Citricoccus alkalitolerans TaxID=246603 RepID=A0ABV8Y2U3_9MICC
MTDPSGRAKGGVARASKMTPAQRKESAQKAAAARWATPEPKRAISGSADRPLMIGDAAIECYVLDDGTRVITQGAMLTALGRSRRVNTKPGDDITLPPILRAQALRPFISDELIEDARPISFVTPSGVRANGYRADVLPQVCEAWLSARSADTLLKSQHPIATAAEIIVRGLARVGIIALIDEATGYQDVRARDALAKILEAYVADELQPWVKTFDVDFYKEMFRLRELRFDPSSLKKPSYFGHLTNDVVYRRVAPGVFDEIKAERAKDEKKRKAKFHQQLTTEVGHPKLREHIASVTTIMKLSDDWTDFKAKLDRVHPIIDPNQPQLWEDEILESAH